MEKEGILRPITIYLNTIRLFNHNIRMYLITSALLGISYFGIINVNLNLYLLRLGYGPEFIGFANGIIGIAFALSSIPSGIMGSRWGNRRMMILGVTFLTAAVGFIPLAEILPNLFQGGWIVFCRLLNGLGFSLFMVNANPFLIASTNSEERNHVFSIAAALQPLLGFVGSIVGGIVPGIMSNFLGISLDHPDPYRYSLVLATLINLPMIPAIFNTQEVSANPKKETSTEKIKIPYGFIAFLILVSFLRVGGEGAARPFFNVYLDSSLGVSTAKIGTLIALGQILGAPSALGTPYFIRRWGKVSTISLGTLGVSIGLLAMAFIPHWGAAGLSYAAIIAMYSITRPAFTVHMMEITSPRWRTRISAITSMAMGFGFSSISLSGGYIITAFGYRSLFLTGVVLSVIGAILFWVYFSIPRGKTEYI